MELKFRQLDSYNVLVIAMHDGKEKEVGRIFTPSGSGNNIKDSIQVCGFTEAFDLWGCGRYSKPKVEHEIFVLDKNNNKIYEHVKDIQLKFDWETEPKVLRERFKVDIPEYRKCNEIKLNKTNISIPLYHKTTKEIDVCWGCFNHPCTCEQKGIKHRNPYIVKRSQDLYKE